MSTHSFTITRLILLILRMGMAVVFLWTGIPKILAPQEFVIHVLDYQMISPFAATIAAMALPWIEVLLGICLLINRWTPGAWLVASALFALFIAVDISALMRGLSIECGCGLGADQLGPWTLIRSGIFFAIGVAGYIAACQTTRDRAEISAATSPTSANVESNVGAC